MKRIRINTSPVMVGDRRLVRKGGCGFLKIRRPPFAKKDNEEALAYFDKNGWLCQMFLLSASFLTTEKCQPRPRNLLRLLY